MLNEVSGLATSPKQISQTEEQLQRTRKEKDQLFNTIGLLTERLKPALRENSPSTVGECEKEQKLTDIAEAIKGLGSDFSFATSQLRNLIDRLEI
jgi:mevalonate kinase